SILGFSPSNSSRLSLLKLNTSAASIPSNSKSAYSLGVMLSLTLAASTFTSRTLLPQLVQILSGENQVTRSSASAKSSRGYHPFALSGSTPSRSGPLYGESG